MTGICGLLLICMCAYWWGLMALTGYFGPRVRTQVEDGGERFRAWVEAGGARFRAWLEGWETRVGRRFEAALDKGAEAFVDAITFLLDWGQYPFWFRTSIYVGVMLAFVFSMAFYALRHDWPEPFNYDCPGGYTLPSGKNICPEASVKQWVAG